MEYQHLVFQEFGRMMQPDIDAFLFEPSADINPNIAAEFAHVVYRFGHSMLRQDIAVIEMDENGNPFQNDITLFDGFLNPVMYDSLGDAETASGAIIRGMTRQTGSEIDEFVTDVLRNQLLGIPLDLPTINIAHDIMGVGPIYSTRKLLDRLKLTMADFDLIEFNEAFASQVIASLRELGVDPFDDRINPHGGGIALGHPLGMTGTRLSMTATHALEKRDGRLALITMCVGVGQGVCIVIERA